MLRGEEGEAYAGCDGAHCCGVWMLMWLAMFVLMLLIDSIETDVSCVGLMLSYAGRGEEKRARRSLRQQECTYQCCCTKNATR